MSITEQEIISAIDSLYREEQTKNVQTIVSAIKSKRRLRNASINYSQYIAEQIDKSISYTEYLAENLAQGISYSEYLSKELNKSLSL